MFKKITWVTVRALQAREIEPGITQAAFDRFEELLNGPLGERHQTQTELASIAKDLIAKMSAESESTDEAQS
jgi:hypothetical protein